MMSRRLIRMQIVKVTPFRKRSGLCRFTLGFKRGLFRSCEVENIPQTECLRKASPEDLDSSIPDYGS